MRLCEKITEARKYLLNCSESAHLTINVPRPIAWAVTGCLRNHSGLSNGETMQEISCKNAGPPFQSKGTPRYNGFPSYWKIGMSSSSAFFFFVFFVAAFFRLYVWSFIRSTLSVFIERVVRHPGGVKMRSTTSMSYVKRIGEFSEPLYDALGVFMNAIGLHCTSCTDWWVPFSNFPHELSEGT